MYCNIRNNTPSHLLALKFETFPRQACPSRALLYILVGCSNHWAGSYEQSAIDILVSSLTLSTVCKDSQFNSFPHRQAAASMFKPKIHFN